MQTLRPIQSINCTDCRANAHQFENIPAMPVTGKCGENKHHGSCFGVILYPIKNPSPQAHERFVHAVQAHQVTA